VRDSCETEATAGANAASTWGLEAVGSNPTAPTEKSPVHRESVGRASWPSLVAGPRLVARARHLGVGRRFALGLLADARARAGRDGLAALGHKLGVVRGAAEPLLHSFEDACDAASIRPDPRRPRPPPRPAWRTDPRLPTRGVVPVKVGGLAPGATERRHRPHGHAAPLADRFECVVSPGSGPGTTSSTTSLPPPFATVAPMLPIAEQGHGLSGREAGRLPLETRPSSGRPSASRVGVPFSVGHLATSAPGERSSSGRSRDQSS
jgi:hypothetical protein